MFWKRASVKFIQKPWKVENISILRYGFREIPEVVGLGLIGLVTVVPYMGYLLMNMRNESYAECARKVNFTVMRPEDMPIEGHKYCVKSSSA